MAKELFGSEDAYDETKNYTQSMTQKLNMLSGRCCGSVCIRRHPVQLGLANDRFAAEKPYYRGDLALEAKFFKAITGEE